MLGGVCGNIVDVFAVHVQGFADECAAAVASAGVTLFETEELDLLLDEVYDMHSCSAGEEWEGRIDSNVEIVCSVVFMRLWCMVSN